MNKYFQQLRKVFEGSDPFMGNRHRGGHQIVGPRRRKRSVPAWARSNEKIKAILLRSFPKLKTHPGQRVRAARWARIIHLYFRMQWTYTQVAEELVMKPANLHNMTTSIRRAAAGKRANNTGEFSTVPKGRPKKSLPIKPSLGGQ
jgi:hypothetical protein